MKAQKSNRQPTVRDLAAAAGVSVATVSRVLNGSSLVLPDTVARVREAMTALNYRAEARRRVRAKTRKLKHCAVCIVFAGYRSIKWVTNCAPIYAYAIHGAVEAFRVHGIHCIMWHAPQEKGLLALKGMSVDGFLVLGGDGWEWPKELRDRPRVKMLGMPSASWTECVTYNWESVGNIAATHLFNTGVLNAVVFGSDGGVLSRRTIAFLQRFSELGGRGEKLVDRDLCRNLADLNQADPEAIGEMVDRLAAMTPRPEGIFVTSDMLLPMLYLHLKRHGIEPTRDIAIVSCNNEHLYLAAVHPAPVEIDIRAEEIGRQAAERLLWRAHNPDAPQASIVLEPFIVV